MRVPWMVAFPGVIDDILRGNIHVFLAAMIVLAPRFAGRVDLRDPHQSDPGSVSSGSPSVREWRPLASRSVVTGPIAGVSFAITPALWFEWFDFLDTCRGCRPHPRVPLPLMVRLPIAAALIAFAALTGRAWTVPIGVMVALPNVWTTLTALLGWPRSRRCWPGDRATA